MNPLAELYSYIDSKKRQLRGLLSDPVETINQGLLNFRDDQNKLLSDVGVGFQLPGYQSVLLSQKQIEDSAKKATDAYMNQAMAAMAAPAKFIYPQDKALEQARKNGVKMLGLPENNTPEMRAKAMGFDAPNVHFSRHGIDTNVLDSGAYAVAPFDAVGTHVGNSEAALDRFRNTVGTTEQFKGTTYPVLIKKGKEFTDSGVVWNEDKLSSKLRAIGGHDWSDVNGGRQTYQQMNAKLRDKLFGEFDSIPYINDVESKGAISHIVPPWNIRSRFAAFDPARINENDLLAGALPFGLLADEETRKKFGF